MYHWEADQEAFLVLAGEAVLVVEGEERPLARVGLRALPAADEARPRRRGTAVRASSSRWARAPTTARPMLSASRSTRSRDAMEPASRRTRWTEEPPTPRFPAASQRRTATDGSRTDHAAPSRTAARAGRLPRVRLVGQAAAGAARADARRPLLGAGLPRAALRSSPAHRDALGLRRSRARRAARRAPRLRKAARDGLPQAPRAEVPDPAHEARRHVRAATRAAGRRRHQRLVPLPARGAVSVRERERELVEPRLRPRDRPEPEREPVRRAAARSTIRGAGRTSTARRSGRGW